MSIESPSTRPCPLLSFLFLALLSPLFSASVAGRSRPSPATPRAADHRPVPSSPFSTDSTARNHRIAAPPQTLAAPKIPAARWRSSCRRHSCRSGGGAAAAAVAATTTTPAGRLRRCNPGAVTSSASSTCPLLSWPPYAEALPRLLPPARPNGPRLPSSGAPPADVALHLTPARPPTPPPSRFASAPVSANPSSALVRPPALLDLHLQLRCP